MRLMIAYDDDCADGHTDNNDNNNDDDEVSRAGSGETEIRAKRGREKASLAMLCNVLRQTAHFCALTVLSCTIGKYTSQCCPNQSDIVH